MKKNIILVRHGLSEYNRQGRMQGSSDASLLSDPGKQMARLVGLFLCRQGADRGSGGETAMRIDAAVSSPLARARETAEIILSQLSGKGPVLKIIDDLRETELYHWQGMTFPEIKQRFPQQSNAWKFNPANFFIDYQDRHIYPIRVLYKRAAGFWLQELPRIHQGNILIVSHSGTIQALINIALGLDENNHHTFQQSNCGLNHLVYDPDKKDFTLHQLNHTPASKNTLPKLKAGRQGLRVILLPAETASLDTHLQKIKSLCPIGEIWCCQTIGHRAKGEETRLINMEDEDTASLFSNTIHQTRQSKLTTILIVAKTKGLKSVLIRHLGIAREFVEKTHFQPNTITTVHHSSSHPTPILQSVNIPIGNAE